jgi:hypothetical protein
MASAAELRAEAAWLRETLKNATNREELAAIQVMIDELERRAKMMDNGGATSD